MELMALNKNFKVLGIVDQYQSLIWQERYTDVCEFQADLPARSDLLKLMSIDNYLKLLDEEHKNSDRVMIVESFDLTTDNSTGKKLVRFSGRSLESLLERRIVWNETVLNGPFEQEFRRLLNENAIEPSNEKRKIPGLIFPGITDTLTKEYLSDITLNMKLHGENLLDVIRDICADYRVGFKITLSKDNDFVFSLYYGKDRTNMQTARGQIVFSTEYDTLISSEYVTSKAAYRNTALVIGEDPDSRCYDWASRHAYAVGYCVKYDGKQYRCKQAHTSQKDHTPDIETSLWEADDLNYQMRLTVWSEDKEPTGVARREIFVDDSSTSSRVSIDDDRDHDIFLTTSQYAQLISRDGISDLYEHRTTSAFDGQVETNLGPQYGKDYFLGDYVTAMNEFGLGTFAQITEYIRSCDENGYSAYPTLEMMNSA